MLSVIFSTFAALIEQLNADAIRPLHEWASTFERLWQHQLQKLKERAEEKMKKV
jgi:hypothetical protein